MVYDTECIIVGSGIVGTLQALLLANSGIKVILLDNTDYLSTLSSDRDNIQLRMSAITLRAEGILSSVCDWNNDVSVRSGLMAYVKVWRDNTEVIFDSKLIGKDYLARVVENDLILDLLYQQAINNSNIKIIRPFKITNIKNNPNNNTSLINGNINNQDVSINTKLIIAADGANSFIRQYFDFKCIIEPYNHHALIANVQTEKPHNNTAHQVFLKSGPIALLPWSSNNNSNICSLVWSNDINSDVSTEYLLHCEDSEFIAILQDKFGNSLGKIEKIITNSNQTKNRVAFPLYKRHSQNYYKNNCVLIGDAAHTIHPLAGQGLNLGIYDAFSLAECLNTAITKGIDINSPSILNKYQLSRRGHNQQMMDIMGLFKYLYGSDKTSINTITKLGMSLVNKSSTVKQILARSAAGLN